MTAPVFVAEDLSGDRIVLTGAEGRHAATVRRLRPGEEVDLVDGRGGRARATVTSAGAGTVVCDVVRRTQEAPPDPRLVLVQALAAKERGELAVELATEVGVDEILPWHAQRCVVRWSGPRGERALERWRATARESGKQARRAFLPQVGPLQTTAQVLARVAAAALAVVLHESASMRLADLDPPHAGDVVLVVGPEGGLGDAELAELAAAGGVVARLGPTVLRASTAGAAAAAVLSARSGRW